MTTVLLRCQCGYSLVEDNGQCIRFHFGEWKLFHDSGKVIARCHLCPIYYVIDPGVGAEHHNEQALPADAKIHFSLTVR